jgi:hypothetical protein
MAKTPLFGRLEQPKFENGWSVKELSLGAQKNSFITSCQKILSKMLGCSVSIFDKKTTKTPLFGCLERSKFENRSSVKAKNCFWVPQKIVSSLLVKKFNQSCSDF